jgi:hypothetical protein
MRVSSICFFLACFTLAVTLVYLHTVVAVFAHSVRFLKEKLTAPILGPADQVPIF